MVKEYTKRFLGKVKTTLWPPMFGIKTNYYIAASGNCRYTLTPTSNECSLFIKYKVHLAPSWQETLCIGDDLAKLSNSQSRIGWWRWSEGHWNTWNTWQAQVGRRKCRKRNNCQNALFGESQVTLGMESTHTYQMKVHSWRIGENRNIANNPDFTSTLILCLSCHARRLPFIPNIQPG